MFAGKNLHELEQEFVEDDLFELSYSVLKTAEPSSNLLSRSRGYEQLDQLIELATDKLWKGELNHVRWQKFEHA